MNKISLSGVSFTIADTVAESIDGGGKATRELAVSKNPLRQFLYCCKAKTKARDKKIMIMPTAFSYNITPTK